MEALARRLVRPAGQRLVARQERFVRRPSSEEIATDVVDAALLDLPLQAGRPRRLGVDEEAIVCGAFPIGTLRHRLGETGPHNRRLQIVGHDARRHAAPGSEGVFVAEQPGLHPLVEDYLGVQMPAPGQHQHEDPALARLATRRVDRQAGIAEVHLRLTPWRHLDPHEGGPLRRAQVRGQAAHRVVADRVAMPLLQPGTNGGTLDPLLPQGANLLPVRRQRGALLRRQARGQRGGQQALQPPVGSGPASKSWAAAHSRYLITVRRLQPSTCAMVLLLSPARTSRTISRISTVDTLLFAMAASFLGGSILHRSASRTALAVPQVAPPVHVGRHCSLCTLADHPLCTLADHPLCTFDVTLLCSIGRLMTCCSPRLAGCYAHAPG